MRARLQPKPASAQLAAALILLIIDSFAQGSSTGQPLVSPARARCGGENGGVRAEMCVSFSNKWCHSSAGAAIERQRRPQGCHARPLAGTLLHVLLSHRSGMLLGVRVRHEITRACLLTFSPLSLCTPSAPPAAEFHEVPLIEARWYNHDTKILTFGLPEDVSLDLPVCACVLLRGYTEGDIYPSRSSHPLLSCASA